MDNDLKINNPHDRLFKETLSKKELAQSFLLNYLPQDILEAFEIESLEICKDSFVEKEFEDYFSDLLYKINIKKNLDGLEKSLGYVYILFEHKSYQDKLVLLQILSYMVKIWQLHIKQNPSKSRIYLPIVLPIVFYHGKPKWKAPKCFADMFDSFENQDKLKNYVPNFSYILCDLANYSNDEIKGHVLLRTTLLLFKNIFKTDFINELPKIFCFNKLDSKLFAKIKNIKDINKLKQIKNAIKACSDIQEIKDLLV